VLVKIPRQRIGDPKTAQEIVDVARAFMAATVEPSTDSIACVDRSVEIQQYHANGLALVTAAIALCTAYLDRALRALRQQNEVVSEALPSHLASLGWLASAQAPDVHSGSAPWCNLIADLRPRLRSRDAWRCTPARREW